MRAFAWFLGLIAASLVAIAVFTYPAWLLLHPHFDFPFHRIGERIGMLALLVGFLLVARRLGLADRGSLGYGLPRRQFLREMTLGLALGAATMLVVVGMMAALGLLEWNPTAPFFSKTGAPAALTRLLISRLLSGLTVALIEETFLRGAMMTAIERESGTRTAVVLTSIVYAASHFFAKFHISPDAVSASSGLDLLAGTLHAFASPLGIADAFLCYLAVGIVLALVRALTGNIAACLGLHAGWVWIMLVTRELSHAAPSAPLGFLLSRWDGFVGWLVLGWTVVMGLGLWRFFDRRRRTWRLSQRPTP